MASKKKSSTLARLMDSVEIKNTDGDTVMVPVTAEDNIIANKILASQMRALIQKSIQKFGGQDFLTPKELKELTEAARNVAEFSGEVYKPGDSLEPKRVEGSDETISDVIDFSKLTNQKQSGTKASEQSESQTPEKASEQSE